MHGEGINGSIYSHPIGDHGHGAGPLIGLWDHQEGVPGRGDLVLRPEPLGPAPAPAPVHVLQPHLMRIASDREETRDVRTLRLEFLDREVARTFTWEAGQFGEFSVFIGNCSADSVMAAIMHSSSARWWQTYVLTTG